MRDFALVIHVEPKGIFPTRISCRWCRACELVIVHKHDLEDMLRSKLEVVSPQQVDSAYVIIGVLDLRIWRRMKPDFADLETVRRWTSDFHNVGELKPEA
jgi:hypothetical protein